MPFLQVKGQAQLPAPRSRVWETLMDPEALQRCLPGCQKFELVAPTEWEATLSVGLASIKGTYSGRVRISDQEAETSYRLTVEGRGAGNRIRGDGVVTLADAPEGGTVVTYAGDAHVLGPLAAVSQRLLQPAAKMLADQFFGCTGKEVQARTSS
ncbi:MAG: carbon monoxide dehydrogenase subunit G [Chloroflexota bacterium]|nr:carbon monoxide dehydrogenase subunit G [Chloroflexota bacterium]